MESNSALIQAAANRWRWLAQSWKLRAAVQDLCAAFSASPTHVELAELKQDNASLEAKLSKAQEAIRSIESDLSAAGKNHREEYAKLKAKYDKRLHATDTEQLEAIKNEVSVERDAKHLIRIELDALKAQVKAKEDEHQLARDGNRALLRFIHTRDRLNVKLEPGTIREMLQHTEKK